MFKRGLSQPRQPSRQCQQCIIEYQVGELCALTSRLSLLEEMQQQRREKRTRRSRSNSEDKLRELHRRLERFETQLRKNADESRRLGRIASQMLEVPRVKETISNYADYNDYSKHRDYPVSSATTFNKHVRPPSAKSRSGSSILSEPLTLDELVQRFSQLMMEGVNQKSLSELNRREELVELAGRIRNKRRETKMAVNPIQEYGL